MIYGGGWHEYNIWEHSVTVRRLYAERCRQEAEEMTCHAQAARILSQYAKAGETLLDVGCGAGYFYHSVQKQQIGVRYEGIDASSLLVKLGQDIMPEYGLRKDALRNLRIEDMSGEADHIMCLNVLTNLDNYHRPLERMLRMARRTVILRESLWDEPSRYQYVRDRYLDEGIDLSVYVNTYNAKELMDFVRSYGFFVERVEDERTGGQAEDVIGYPHHWTFIVATREEGENAA